MSTFTLKTEEHLAHKEQIAENFDEAYTTLIYNNEEGRLVDLLEPDTIDYFSGFDESVVEDLQSFIESLKLDGNDDLALKYTTILDEFNNIDISDYSRATDLAILEHYDFYRNEYLEDDINRLKEELTKY